MQIPRCTPSLTPLLATLLAIGCGAAMPESDTSGAEANVVFGSRVHKMPMNASAITPNATSATLTYYGGRVVSNTQVVQVLYGSGSYNAQVSGTSSPNMGTFYQGVLNSAYVDWLDQEYNTVNPSPAGSSTKTNQHIGRGSFLSRVQITPSSANNGSTIDDSQIQAELAAQIQAGHLPAPSHDAAGNNNTYYAVFFPPGKTITQGGSSSCVSGGFCAYHGTVASVSGFGEIYYGVHPDMQSGSGCATGCGSSTTFNNYTSVASHELIEMVTDAEVGLATTNAPPLAWYDNTNGEIGDICNAQQGTVTGSDGVSYTVQKEWSNHSNACIVSETVTTTNNFSVSVSPSSASVNAGSSVSYTVTTATTAGSAQTVSFSVSGLPAGVTGAFSPTSVSSGQSATLTLTASSSAASATATFTVTGSAASGSHTATASVTVIGGTVSNDFSISANPSTLSIAAGGSGTSTISTATTAGSASTVSFSVSGAPSGASASVSPTSVTSGGSATLTVNAGSAAAGTYTVTVTGSNGSATHSAGVSVTIGSGGGGGGAVVNGNFEAGSLSGWTASGASESVVSSGCHGGTYCARMGSTSPTSGDSSIAQTFTPSSSGTLSFFYKVTCPDTLTYDWATATLKDNTAGTTATVLARTCSNNGTWSQASASVTGGHSYTLTLTSHDDNYASDPTYTLYDDVTVSASAPPPSGITNGGFETGSLSGWTASGAHTAVTTSSHSGSYAALAGNTTPTNGDSSLSQTFTAPSGTSRLSLYYASSCPDTVTYDWVIVTLKDITSGTTTTVVPKTCASSYTWTNATAAVTAGHSYTLTLTSHDDNYSGDPTFTLFDDVVLQ